MRIAVPKEIRHDEHRVALVPDTVSRLLQGEHEVWIETGAGVEASFSDAAYAQAGAVIIPEAARLWGEADILLKVAPPTERDTAHEVALLGQSTVLIGLLNPLQEIALVRQLIATHRTAFSMDLIPRLSRAQQMDALSSQATVAGYKSALMAADALGKFFPMLTTAAGTIAPAKVLVIGAGVAGLMAIATARRLGAVVEGFDIRPAVREEVQSLGATFVGVELSEPTDAEGGYARAVSEAAQQREQEILSQHIAAADVVITAAQVPGKRAPVLVTEAMLDGMRPGSVLVDLAADQGGNCACTETGQEIVRRGVTILGPRNVPSLMALPASQMYARNMLTFLRHLLKDGALHIDLTEEITHGACVTYAGTVQNDVLRQTLDALGTSTCEPEGGSC